MTLAWIALIAGITVLLLAAIILAAIILLDRLYRSWRGW